MKLKTKNKHTNQLDFQKLSIQVSLNGLSFCILDTIENEITDIRHFQFNTVTNPLQLETEINTIFEQHAEILEQSFQAVTVSHINTLSTFVPKPLFSDKNLADYLKYNNKILANDYMTFDVISNNDMVNVYIPYVNINNLFFEKYGAFTYRHFATILIENIFQLSNNSEEPTVYVHVQKEQFEIIIIQNKKLLLYNSFEYSSSEDFIYYLLFTLEQLELNTNTLQLYFLGDISKEDVLYTVAYTYIRNVDFLEKNYSFNFTTNVEKPASHRDFTLLTNF
ncbi:DUF3822 family protein [Kordia sp. YSTF-M3]|uniref:DUF3822 family protein n=1 Tax=Kordia aestuariivivens TaxID=2759037 RepID=A0ABR7Q5H8_9FLAO|nr:DUF3822 family protein [Kordia aestuariivivens]MBC8753763.1 DUF3822 family protein [Kordia aestuariivivens]